jgi:cation diffusion facilitator CzcD-associated flavoprotein CzcO
VGADDSGTGSPKILIIGAGFGGIGMGIGLRKAGFDDFLILEKTADLGGTWRDNRYPGCACDVPSPLYSFSYELNPDWSRLFAPQQEIWEYLRRCAATYGIDRHIKYGSRVESVAWDDADRLWTVRTADGKRYRTRAVVSGAGALHLPSYPDIAGIDEFAGESFHSSRWNHAADLTGKRVAVIGTGASAIQFVPAVAGQAARLTVFQRTPPWLQPRPDVSIPDRMRAVLRTVPGAARALRYAVYWGLETRALGFAVDPRLMAPMEALALRHLERQVPDPELRARLTPDYTIGCKRILVSSDYYPALQRPMSTSSPTPSPGLPPQAS